MIKKSDFLRFIPRGSPVFGREAEIFRFYFSSGEI